MLLSPKIYIYIYSHVTIKTVNTYGRGWTHCLGLDQISSWSTCAELVVDTPLNPPVLRSQERLRADAASSLRGSHYPLLRRYSSRPSILLAPIVVPFLKKLLVFP